MDWKVSGRRYFTIWFYIIRAKFLDFGVGYASDFSSSIISSAYDIYTHDYFSKTGVDVSIKDSVSNIKDSGSINKHDYSSGLYVDPTYVGAPVTEFSSTTSSVVIGADQYALIAIYLGPVALYPGYYTNTDGFISDDRYIQDGKYYQTYSYVLKIDELFDSYKSVVKNILHPAGTELFGEYTIDNSYDSSTNLVSVTTS